MTLQRNPLSYLKLSLVISMISNVVTRVSYNITRVGYDRFG